jgi:hypothetical protein
MSLVDQGCDPNGKFAMVIHGWQESINTWWVMDLVSNLMNYRGGCIVFMDYSNYSFGDYGVLVTQFDKISAVASMKVKQIENYDRMYCFGFSYGSRLCIDVGFNLGDQSNGLNLIKEMELCDPAGPGFNGQPIAKDPKKAAKNVACINTSNGFGTNIYNCHQNFRMGRCGEYQDAQGPYPLGSHGLCVKFFNLAFTVNYTPNNYFNCPSTRLATNLTENVTMGYLGNFNRSLIQGDIFIATAKSFPYKAINGIIT